MSTVESRWGTGPNAEAIEAWNGPLFERFAQFRHLLVDGLGRHGDEALRLFPPQPGQRVLDIGCGFGDTTQQIARLVGPEGAAVGVDAADRFVQSARAEAEAAGLANARFMTADVEWTTFDETYDAAFSRFGTMFFANPVAALRNVRRALVPGGRLVMVVWRRREDNLWVVRSQRIVDALVQRPEQSDEPTCGPGPFSMADADTTSDVLRHAGFQEIALHRCDESVLGGHDMEEAIDYTLALGPAAEALRLAGDDAAHLHGVIREQLRDAFADFVQPDGRVWSPASSWIVTARAPLG